MLHMSCIKQSYFVYIHKVKFQDSGLKFVHTDFYDYALLIIVLYTDIQHLWTACMTGFANCERAHL